MRLAVRWRLRDTLGFRDGAERLLQRGFEVSHEPIRAWKFRFAPLRADRLRAKRRSHAGRSWYLDETDSVRSQGSTASRSLAGGRYDLGPIWHLHAAPAEIRHLSHVSPEI